MAQTLHKYADVLLLVLFGILGWWQVNLDKRLTINADRVQAIVADVSAATARSDAVMRRLDQIDNKLAIIDNRIYQLIGQQHRGDAQ